MLLLKLNFGFYSPLCPGPCSSSSFFFAFCLSLRRFSVPSNFNCQQRFRFYEIEIRIPENRNRIIHEIIGSGFLVKNQKILFKFTERNNTKKKRGKTKLLPFEAKTNLMEKHRERISFSGKSIRLK